MRIAQIAPLYESVPPKMYGGTERVVSYLTEELVRRGHAVTLLASGDSRTSARLVPLCPKALRLDDSIAEDVPPHLCLLDEVKRREEEFDLLHFHIPWFHLPVARYLNRPHVSTVHNGITGPEFADLFERFGDDAPMVSISNSHRQPRRYANWVATIHHGLPQDLYRPGTGEGQYAAFLGRFSPEKGPDRAIEIARRSGIPLKIAAKLPDKDSDRVYFDRAIKPHLDDPLIEYVGEIGESEKAQFLGNAACLLFPISWEEPFGMVLIEALAAGTPVIAFRCGSVPEIIEHGVTGYVVDSVDSAVVSVGKLPLISRGRCRAEFERRFTVRRMADDYLRLYARLAEIARRKSSRLSRRHEGRRLDAPSSSPFGGITAT